MGVGEGDLLDALEIDALQDLPAVLAPQQVRALAPQAQQLDRLAFAREPRGIGAGEARDVGVEASAQPALGGHDDQKVRLVLAGAHQQRGCAGSVGALVEIGQHAVHTLRIGPRGGGGLLRAAQLGGGDHLHGLGDFARGLHGADAVAKVFEAGHWPALLPF